MAKLSAHHSLRKHPNPKGKNEAVTLASAGAKPQLPRKRAKSRRVACTVNRSIQPFDCAFEEPERASKFSGLDSWKPKETAISRTSDCDKSSNEADQRRSMKGCHRPGSCCSRVSGPSRHTWALAEALREVQRLRLVAELQYQPHRLPHVTGYTGIPPHTLCCLDTESSHGLSHPRQGRLQ